MHEVVQRKILAESELTSTKAVHIAQAAETVRDETHALRGNTYHKATTLQGKSKRRLAYNMTQQVALARQGNY